MFKLPREISKSDENASKVINYRKIPGVKSLTKLTLEIRIKIE